MSPDGQKIKRSKPLADPKDVDDRTVYVVYYYHLNFLFSNHTIFNQIKLYVSCHSFFLPSRHNFDCTELKFCVSFELPYTS